MKKLIVANWKMNPQNLLEAKRLFNCVKFWSKRNSKILKNIEVVICPPFVYLEPLSKLLKSKTKIKLGAQNFFWEEKGAFTGEISPKMLKNLRVDYVIVGHSERRKILGETNEMINKKIKIAQKLKLKPILCIGETFRERKEGRTFEVLKNQIKRAIKNLDNKSLKRLILAYEPIWAIGTKNPCQPEEAKKILLFLQKFIPSPILYGGSVNSENAENYIKSGFNGLLVGGASLNQEEFIGIIKNILRL